MIDFHSHVLPKMDDGSRSTEQSLEMLKASWNQGIDQMVATSHYYRSREDIASFLSRRAASYARLQDVLSQLPDDVSVPELRLGAEVAFFYDMSADPDLEKLRTEGTRYILIEMPFSPWSSGILNEIYAVISRVRLTPLIAHIERYPDFDHGWEKLEELAAMGAVFQINADLLFQWKTRRRALKILKGGNCVIGSDCHNTSDRPQQIGKALKIAERKLVQGDFDRMVTLGRRLLNPDA